MPPPLVAPRARMVHNPEVLMVKGRMSYLNVAEPLVEVGGVPGLGRSKVGSVASKVPVPSTTVTAWAGAAANAKRPNVSIRAERQLQGLLREGRAAEDMSEWVVIMGGTDLLILQFQEQGGESALCSVNGSRLPVETP